MADASPDAVVERIRALFAERGNSQYGGEAVTQLEHGLQAAWLAEQDGAAPSLIAAALLHDIGHLLHNLPEDAPETGIDDVHEALGERWLKRHFPPEVSEPVRLHVAAKRYLCAVEPEYEAALSGPSRHSLMLQGGPYDAAGVRQFEAEPLYRECVRVRRWDDQAKVAQLETPDLEHFLGFVRTALTG